MKVDLIDHMGSDLSVVNAARVSFDKQSDWVEESEDGDIGYDEPRLSDKDTKLIQFLARGLTTDDFESLLNNIGDAWLDENDEEALKLLWSWRRTPEHFAPFAHPHISFRISAPIFVARQLGKHQVGMVWSEVSRRYVSGEPEFYVPEVWRKKADNVKQGSSDEAVDTVPMPFVGFTQDLGEWHRFEVPVDDTVFNQFCLDYYNHKLSQGVCPEQARMVLPQSMMTEWIWTGSLYGWANIYNKRKPGSHAQRECWPIAEQIAYHMATLFPVSWEALTK